MKKRMLFLSTFIYCAISIINARGNSVPEGESSEATYRVTATCLLDRTVLEPNTAVHIIIGDEEVMFWNLNGTTSVVGDNPVVGDTSSGYVTFYPGATESPVTVYVDGKNIGTIDEGPGVVNAINYPITGPTSFNFWFVVNN